LIDILFTDVSSTYRSYYVALALPRAQTLIAVLFGDRIDRCGFVRSTAMEKHELNKIEFEIIDDALKALLQSRPDPVTADQIADLLNMFRDAYTGWLEIEKEAVARRIAAGIAKLPELMRPRSGPAALFLSHP
jgi:hypothetical protein